MKIKIAHHLQSYTVERIAVATHIDQDRVEAILNAQERPSGTEMVMLCNLEGKTNG